MHQIFDWDTGVYLGEIPEAAETYNVVGNANEWGVVIGMAIVFFYAVLGGMKGITYTQVAQYCVLIFAYMVPAIFISMQLKQILKNFFCLN